MSRQLYRVPLDFDWPIDKAWKGFVKENPWYRPCPDCEPFEGSRQLSGQTKAGRFIADLAQKLMWNHRQDPELDQLTSKFAIGGRAPMGAFGHDTGDMWQAYNKIIEAAGLDPKVWGICQTCKGKCRQPEFEEAYQAWASSPEAEREGPPEGPGWQLWETVSEGSPISQVFATSDELIHWMVNHEGYSQAAAEHFCSPGQGWAPTGLGGRRADGSTFYGNDVEGLALAHNVEGAKP